MIFRFTVTLGLICYLNAVSAFSHDLRSHKLGIRARVHNVFSGVRQIFKDNALKPSLKNETIVRTKYGDIKGQRDEFNNEEAHVYFGIRYSKPPVGELRFRKPEPVDEGTIKTFGLQSEEKVACVQPENPFLGDDLQIREDCLHLNIWVPQVKESSLPVMIWIHGGFFHMGSGNQDEFNGIVLSTLGKVIVVTLNYRLGFFGFFNAGTEDAAGNMGLYDQAAALNWVKENIKSFGGDPNQITLFGESAGALSVGILTVSPITRNLFQRAIIESGSPYSPIRPEPAADVFKKSLVLSKAINCSDSNAEEFTASTLECLRNVDSKVIDGYGGDEVLGYSQILPNPIFGDEFIPANIHNIMKNPENMNKNLELLLGINRDEGFLFILEELLPLIESSKPITKDDVYLVVRKLLEGRPVDPNKVADYYFQNITSYDDPTSLLNTFSNFYGDLYINCPVYYLTKRFKDTLGHENIHSYMLTNASSVPIIPICKEWSRVCHADELVLIFGVPLRNPDHFNDFDKELSENLVRLWTGFANTGKFISPNPNNWFYGLPPDDAQTFYPEKTYTCEDFWRELFENEMD